LLSGFAARRSDAALFLGWAGSSSIGIQYALQENHQSEGQIVVDLWKNVNTRQLLPALDQSLFERLQFGDTKEPLMGECPTGKKMDWAKGMCVPVGLVMAGIPSMMDDASFPPLADLTKPGVQAAFFGSPSQ